MVGNDGWESVATDIVGIHDYDTDGLLYSDRRPKVPLERILLAVRGSRAGVRTGTAPMTPLPAMPPGTPEGTTEP